MNLEKSFTPQKTQKARELSKLYQAVDHRPNSEWLNQCNALIYFVSPRGASVIAPAFLCYTPSMALYFWLSCFFWKNCGF
jgi:hypothetical protein